MAAEAPCQLSVAIPEAIAARQGVDPTNLKWSLREYISPDALDNLQPGPSRDWHLEVEVAGHTVTVESDESLLVEGTEYPWCPE